MSVIYLVMGRVGAWDDVSEWPVRAFGDPERANSFASWCNGNKDRPCFAEMNDPMFRRDFRGREPTYTVRVIPFGNATVRERARPVPFACSHEIAIAGPCDHDASCACRRAECCGGQE